LHCPPGPQQQTRRSGVRKTVRLSDPAATATGLPLCARRAGVIDRLLHSRRSATAAPQQVNADGVTLVDAYPHPTLRYA